MNSRTASKLNMYQKVLSFIVSNTSFFTGFVPLEELIATFTTGVDDLEKLLQITKKDSSGLADEKQSLRVDMGELALVLGNKGYSWAKKLKKTEEQAILDVELSDFTKGNIQKSITDARNVYDTLNTNLAALTGYRIVADDLAELKKAIDDLALSNPKPQLKIGENKEKNKEVFGQLRKNDESLDDMERLIIGEFRRSTISLVNGFLASRRIDDPGSRKTALLLEIVNEKGEAISLAYCDVAEMENEEQYTDASGLAEIKGMKSGKLTLLVTKDEYLDSKLNFAIKRGERKRLKVVMVKVG